MRKNNYNNQHWFIVSTVIFNYYTGGGQRSINFPNAGLMDGAWHLFVMRFHGLAKPRSSVTLYIDCREVATYQMDTKFAKSFHKAMVQQATFKLGNAGFQPRVPLYGAVQNPMFYFGGTVGDVYKRYEECGGGSNEVSNGGGGGGGYGGPISPTIYEPYEPVVIPGETEQDEQGKS